MKRTLVSIAAISACPDDHCKRAAREKEKELTMRRRQLWLLIVPPLQLVANGIKQLDVALLGILCERRDEGIRHCSRRSAGLLRVRRRLRVFTTRPHDDVGRGSLGLLVPLCCARVLVDDFFPEGHDAGNHPAHVAAEVAHSCAQQTLAGLGEEVGLFDRSLGGIHIWQIERRARVTRVENRRETASGREGAYHYIVHLVVDDMAGLLEVDGVDDFVVSVVLVAVEVFGLPAVARVMEEQGVVGLRTLYQPPHRRDDIRMRRHLAGIACVIGEDDNVVGAVSISLDQELLDVVRVVDASCESGGRADVVDADLG